MADSLPGSTGLYPNALESVDGTLMFAGDNGSGRELWTLRFRPRQVVSGTVRLVMFVDGQQVAIPANVGVNANGTKGEVFTTDATGTLTIDPAKTTSLGDFFDIWRTAGGLAGNNANALLTDHQLMGNVANTSKTVQMFVNGQVSKAFNNYLLQPGDQIVLVYGDNPVVSLNTNFGPIIMELYEQQTPGTVSNFLKYVNDGDYNNSFFHRSVANFVIQGGGFKTTSTTFTSTAQFSAIPTDAPITNEPGISNVRGTVAMAKLGGDPNSATSQFFVNLSNSNSFLDTAANNSLHGLRPRARHDVGRRDRRAADHHRRTPRLTTNCPRAPPTSWSSSNRSKDRAN